MKKQISIIAGIMSAIVFFSCSKEKTVTKQTDQQTEAPTITSTQLQKGSNLPGAIKGLEGLYEFNSSLKEKTGKLADAISSIPTAVLYTTDRKGISGRAILFSGRYGLQVPNVPCQSSMSIAAWVKYTSANAPLVHMIYGSVSGLTLSHENDIYYGIVSTPATTNVPSPAMDNGWHHIVATYDAVNLRFYVDGNYIGSSFNPVTPWSGGFFPYYISYYPGNNIMWQGAMDDLRFYSRTLSASEVQQIYNQ